MIKNFYCILVEGRELKTERELKDYYLNKIKEFKKADKQFIELPYVQNEREWVIEMLKDFEPADNDSELFKNNLFRYLASFLNMRLTVAEEEFKNLPDNFEASVNQYASAVFDEIKIEYEKQISLIDETGLKQKFIQQQIDKTEANSIKWLNEVNDLSKDYKLKGEFSSGQKYLAFLKEKLKELDDNGNNIYFYKDGVQVKSTWDFLNETGFVKGMKESYGATINPTNNYEELKKVRQGLYTERKQTFIKERELEQLPITNFELNCHYLAWLNNEKGKVIKGWLSNKPSVSSQIELLKYDKYVSKEIEATENRINPQNTIQSESDSDDNTLINYNKFFGAYKAYLLNAQSAIDTYANFDNNLRKFNPKLINYETKKPLTKAQIAAKREIEYKHLKEQLTDKVNGNLAEIENTIHRAKHEIQNLSWKPNPNTPLFLEGTKRKLKDLSSRIKELDRKNVLDTYLHLALDENIQFAEEFYNWFFDEILFESQYDVSSDKPSERVAGQQSEGNNFIVSTIEDWLYPFLEEKILSDSDYENLTAALKYYFEKGTFPKESVKINVRRVNKKRFGWALNEIFRALNTNNENLSKEYLLFAKKSISIFREVPLDEEDLLRSNLYKYFTTKVN